MKITTKLIGAMFLLGLARVAVAADAGPTDQERAEQERDRAKQDAANKAEIARLTPEIHAQAKALADKEYPSTAAALKAATASPHRKPGNADRDKYRHPIETLTFLGLQPTMTVVEFGPGEGWYTELLAPTLAHSGKLYVTGGQRTKNFLARLPEAYGKVDLIKTDDAKPDLDHAGAIDMILVFRELHGMAQNKHLDAWLAAFNKALKPGGIVGVEQHRAAPGKNPEESAKSGYLPEKWVISRFEAAGFKLAGKSEINANPKDKKNYPEGVWTLPPSFALGDKDRAKYAAIGESDRMTLKFVKK
jgi:predicted methyltransferase